MDCELIGPPTRYRAVCRVHGAFEIDEYQENPPCPFAGQQPTADELRLQFGEPWPVATDPRPLFDELRRRGYQGARTMLALARKPWWTHNDGATPGSAVPASADGRVQIRPGAPPWSELADGVQILRIGADDASNAERELEALRARLAGGGYTPRPPALFDLRDPLVVAHLSVGALVGALAAIAGYAIVWRF